MAMSSSPLDVTSPIGVVIWSLVAIAIAGVAGWYRSYLVRSLRHMWLRLRRRANPVAHRMAYALRPGQSSRALAGQRTKNVIDLRLRQLRSGRRKPVVLVGGVYLDVWVEPVELPLKLDMEVNDLDPVRVRPGGACFYVGRNLWNGFDRRSWLFTQVGKGGVLSRHLTRLLKDEPWIKGDYMSTAKDSDSGVSVHVVDRYKGYAPTLTHKGALSSFGWNSIIDDLQRCMRHEGGVLYISSFFRTNLSSDFVSSINKLSPQILVILDHGRFQPRYHVTELASLLEAFRKAAVDIYICTYGEIVSLARGAGLPVPTNNGEVEIQTIASFAKAGILPKVTVIRGDQEDGQPRALFVFDHEVSLIAEGPDDWAPANRPGSKEAFTAGFIEHLYVAGPTEHAEELLANAVRAGLRHWADQ